VNTKAKSSDVAPLGNDFISPFGKYKISLEYKFILKSSTKSTAFVSEFSKASLSKFNQTSKPLSSVAPFYIYSAQHTFSAISSIRSLRTCTSTTAFWSHNQCARLHIQFFGDEIQSRKRLGLGL
jgi:hypothetical protein